MGTTHQEQSLITRIRDLERKVAGLSVPTLAGTALKTGAVSVRMPGVPGSQTLQMGKFLVSGRDAFGVRATSLDGTPTLWSYTFSDDGTTEAGLAGIGGGGGGGGGAGPYSVDVPGLVANGGSGSPTDDGPAIQAVLDSLGVSGTHAFEVVAQAPPTGIIYINSTVQVDSDNTTLRFGSPLLFGPSGRIRIQGETAETPTTGKPRLGANVSSGSYTITVNNAAPFAAGSYIVIRGARGANGDPAENQKEYRSVSSVSGTTLTLSEPLENSYVTFNSGSPVTSSQYTEVTRVLSSKASAAFNRGDRTVTVTDTSIFAAGDYVQVVDDAHTIDASGAPELTNYKHREMAEVRQIVSGTQLRLSHALHHTYDTATARVVKVNPVKHSHIRTGNVSWSAMSTVNNAFEIRYGVLSSITDIKLAGDGSSKSWLAQAFRMSDSYLCHIGDGCYATDPANTSSGKGYGVTLYGATECTVHGAWISAARHSVLFFNGSCGNIVQQVISEDVCLSDFDLHGAECVDNLVTTCVVVGGDSAATDGSTNKSALRVGNTTHTDGDHHNVFDDILIVNYQGAALEVVPQSDDTTFRNIRISGAWYGLKLVTNSSNTALAMTNTFLENVDFADISTSLFNVNGGASSIVRGVTMTNCRLIRPTTGLTVSNAQKIRMIRNTVVDPSLPSGTYAVNASGVTGLKVKGNDFSDMVRGVKLASCPSARVTRNTMHDMTETTVFEDAGGNTGALFRDNDVFGFTPIVSTTGSGPSAGLVALLDTPYISDIPARHGFAEWNFDPTMSPGGSALVSGTKYVIRLTAQTNTTISSIVVGVTSAGSGLTSGQNLAALFDSTGALLGSVTADQSAVWNSTGVKAMSIGSVQLRAGADYYVEIVSNATTPPTLLRGSTNPSSANAGQSNALQRFSTNGTGTSIGSTVTLSSNSGTGALILWVALQ